MVDQHDIDYAGQPRQDKLQSLPVMAGFRNQSPQMAAASDDPTQVPDPGTAPLVETEDQPGVEQQSDWTPAEESRTPKFGDFSPVPERGERYLEEAA